MQTAEQAFIIEKDVPVAPDGRGSRKWPHRLMAAGDSFDAGPYGKSLQVAASAANVKYAKALGGKFVTRKVGDRLRVWRIA